MYALEICQLFLKMERLKTKELQILDWFDLNFEGRNKTEIC